MPGQIPQVDADAEHRDSQRRSADAPAEVQWRRENWELQCRLAETQHALTLARAELDRTLTSRSWRVTQLFRRLADSVRQAFRVPDAVAKAKASQLRSRADFAEPGPRGDARLLLVDVTELAIANLQGGIQHTVKGVLSEWLLEPPQGWHVVPVQLTKEGEFVSASSHLTHIFGSGAGATDGRITVRTGDVYIGLDLLRDHPVALRNGLAQLKRQGVHIQMVVYDLLPVDMPQCVPPWIAEAFGNWLEVVGDMADGVSCISRTVALRFERWLASRSGRNAGIKVDSFGLGVPALARAPGTRLASGAAHSFLMVGTIEPRKGYVDALDAFDALWADQLDVRLTIVGRYGWGMSEFAGRLEAHPEAGRRLTWLKRATDDEVQACYEASDALLFCSYGEGFGLPIIEAAQHGLPLVLRDLPEFREVAGTQAQYFNGDAGEVAKAVRQWIDLSRAGRVTPPDPGIAISWQDSARQLLASVMTAVHAVQAELQG